jgi:hypothetical protein
MVDTEPFCELFTHDGKRQDESWHHLTTHFLWLPTLEQLTRELSLRTKFFKLVFENVCTGSSAAAGYWVSCATESGEEKKVPSLEVYHAANPEEAMGTALLSLLQNNQAK